MLLFCTLHSWATAVIKESYSYNTYQNFKFQLLGGVLPSITCRLSRSPNITNELIIRFNFSTHPLKRSALGESTTFM